MTVKSYSRRIENRDNLEHVGEEDFIEEIWVAFFEAAEVDIFLETIMFASKLGKAALTVVSVKEVRRYTRRR